MKKSRPLLRLLIWSVSVMMLWCFCGKTESLQDFEGEEVCFFAENEQEARRIAEEMGAAFQWWDGGICSVAAGKEQYAEIPLYADTWVYSGSADPGNEEEFEEWHLDAVHAPKAWEQSQGEGVVIAVVDTGINRTHTEFDGCIVGAETVIPESAYKKNGYFQAEYQGPEDYLGHGTQVAGLIAARADHAGTTGVAPKAKVLSIKALESDGVRGNGKTSWVVAAIGRAVDAGADIINLSVGGALQENDLLLEAICRAEESGALVVCAAGNSGTSAKSYPAAYPETVAVSAIRQKGSGYVIASYSNYGDWIDICAPGSNLYAPTLGNGYELATGTSMACPLVSAGAALLLEEAPMLSPNQLKMLLMESAEDLGAKGYDMLYGTGMLDLEKALQLLQEKSVLVAPRSDCIDGSVITDECTVDWSADCLFGSIHYTLDGTEPDESSPLWPAGGRTFPTGEVSLKLAVCSDGEVGPVAEACYRVIRSREILTGSSGEQSFLLPTYGPRENRFEVEIPAGKVWSCGLGSSGKLARLVLEDANGTQLSAGKSGKLKWTNKSGETVAGLLRVTSDSLAGFSLKWEYTTPAPQSPEPGTVPDASYEETEPAETPEATEATTEETVEETTEATVSPTEDSTEQPTTEETLFRIELIPDESVQQTEETQVPEVSQDTVPPAMNWLPVLLVILTVILLAVIVCLIKCFR